MKKILSILFAMTLVLSLAACAKQGSDKDAQQSSGTSESENSKEVVTVTHSLGLVEVPFDPQRVVVLDLAALDIIDSLGLGDKVVGMPKSSSVSYLTSYIENESIGHMGSLKEVDMEALMSAEPDVIFIGGRLSAEYENLSKIAPTVLVSIDHTVGYMETFEKNVENIASIFGVEKESQKIIAGFSDRITALNEAANGKTAIVGLVSSGSVSTLGNGSRCSLISREIGFENLAVDVDSTHGDASSFELLVDINPEYIFVLDRDTAINAEGASIAKDVMNNELVAKTDAYQNDKIIYLTPDVWYLSEGGITATDIMLKDLETGLLK